MEKNEMQVLFYNEIIKRVNQLYGTRVDVEHEFIHEFFEGPLPLFKLILAHQGGDTPVMLVSFHLELDSTAAIQWFLRIRQLDPNLHITGCYLRDEQGNTHVGEDAYILRMYMIEQDILANYMANTKDAEDFFGDPVKLPKPSPIKSYHDYKSAVAAFQKLEKKKGDVEH